MSKKVLQILTLPVGQMKANCYLIIEKISRKCLVVDAGDDADYIETVIREKRLLPQAILATHGHFDHLMAATQVQLDLKIPFMIHKNDVFLVKNMTDSAKHFIGIDPGPPPVINDYLDNEKEIDLDSIKLKIIETPGHTPGSLCFYQKSNEFIICGDLIFTGGGVGRADFSYSNKKRLEKSIKQILHLPVHTVLYPGHGPRTTVRDELKYYTL